MQKAMFLRESYKKGILSEVDTGYILTLNVPDVDDIQRKLDPFRIEMISYSGVKSIQPIEEGLQFVSAGRKILCLIEPMKYPQSYVEPTLRSTNTTAHIPFRFKECTSFITNDNKFRILLPDSPIECYDSFTVEFPKKGDICVLYFIFDDNINGIVLPYIKTNLEMILKSAVDLRAIDAKKVSSEFVKKVSQFHIWNA